MLGQSFNLHQHDMLRRILTKLKTQHRRFRQCAGGSPVRNTDFTNPKRKITGGGSEVNIGVARRFSFRSDLAVRHEIDAFPRKPLPLDGFPRPTNDGKRTLGFRRSRRRFGTNGSEPTGSEPTGSGPSGSVPTGSGCSSAMDESGSGSAAGWVCLADSACWAICSSFALLQPAENAANVEHRISVRRVQWERGRVRNC